MLTILLVVGVTIIVTTDHHSSRPEQPRTAAEQEKADEQFSQDMLNLSTQMAGVVFDDPD